MTRKKARRPYKPVPTEQVTRRSRPSWLRQVAIGAAGTIVGKVVVAVVGPLVMESELVEAGREMISRCGSAPTQGAEAE